LDLDPDFSFGGHCEAVAELAPDAQAVWKMAQARVDDRDDEEQDIVCEGEPGQPRASP